MVLSVVSKVIYPPPASVVVNALSVISFLTLSNAGWMEIKGKHMQYSKLGNNKKKKEKDEKAINNKVVVPSKVGMFVLYAPAFVAGLSSFALYPAPHFVQDFRFTLLCSAVTLHFFKRVFEVLFVHKFSGSMDVEAMVTISLSYFTNAVGIIYNQHLTQSLPQPSIDLKYLGVPIFLLGIAGNFYHHFLLSKLRSDNQKGEEKQYKIPRGGLFGWVICPHYLFEIVGFLGIACISQTPYAVLYFVGITFYLMGRSYATRKWYESKFDDFPEDVKALFPYIF
ncbi:very-long-chain enoyl-coa reductase [Phtheirospermum japonicum]|uniref:Very-long-chain enoyl-coa reductase n=1 Tax=Phtheirospermum japonicum TaxID=374723 RepID=A0A830D448_9LAMI|nr:very-long-chain enoyl-coa reductase [Phtheirospermum japonicum]